MPIHEENHMTQPLPFWEVVEAADHLSGDEQAALLDILRRRLSVQARKAHAADVKESRQEFAQGLCKLRTVDEIMKEILP
jgi:hypothetical protein